MKKPANPGIKKEYNKEYNRIKRFIESATKRGYNFDVSALPKKSLNPSLKQLERLKQIKPENLYRKATFIDPLTGGVVSGTTGRKIERQIASAKSKIQKNTVTTTLPRESDAVLSNIRGIVDKWTPERFAIDYTALDSVKKEISSFTGGDNWSSYWLAVKLNHKNKLETILDNTIRAEGEQRVAYRLQQSADLISLIVSRILYGSDEEQVQFDLVQFATILLGRTMTADDNALFTDVQEGQEEFE